MVSDMKTSGTRAVAMVLAALLLPLGIAAAQTQARAGGRDSIRVLRRIPLTRENVLQRIDSLRRVLDEGHLDSLEYMRAARTVNGLVFMLEESALREMQDEMRRSFDVRITTGEQTEQMARELARRAQLVQRTTPAAAVSRGWIGLNVEAPHIQRVTGGRMYVRYLEYPEVVSVEPNSPAEQAGVARGDIVLAFDGRDVMSNEVNVSQILTPRKKLAVTLRRDTPSGDRTRVVSLTVAPSPDHVKVRREDAYVLPPEGMPYPAEAPMPPEMPMRPGMRIRTPRPPVPDDNPTGVWVQSAPEPPATPQAWVFAFDGASAPVAGATLATLNAELGRRFGASEGLLVLSAAHGSPAREAGLRGGDVIVKAAGRPVRSLAQFRSLVAAQSSNGRRLELEIRRANRTMTLQMDWRGDR